MNTAPVSEDTAALYIHVPFCKGKCDYCAFHSVPVSGVRNSEIEGVVEACLLRAEALRERFSIAEYSTAYVGGGTPTALPFWTLRRLLEAVGAMGGRRGFREWTVEANPESLDEDKLRLFSDLGVDRISLGVQSLEPRALAESGRGTLPFEIDRALNLVSSLWKGRFSADLMIGLPGQTQEGFLSGIAGLASAGAEHLSIYELTLEEGTPLAAKVKSGLLRLPPDEEVEDFWSAAREECSQYGFLRYEVSNWAKQGAECLHNLGYWKGGAWVGAGPSGVSSFPVSGGGALRIEEGRNHTEYAVDPARVAREEEVPPATAAFEAVMTAFRTREGLDEAAFQRRFGVPSQTLFGDTFRRWDAHLVQGERGLAPSERLMDILNRFLVDCLEELDHTSLGYTPISGGSR